MKHTAGSMPGTTPDPRLNRLLYLLVLLKLIVPFFLQNAAFQPHRDEFLYLAEGRHPAWGYMEVPPLLSVFAWITNTLGGGMFWINFWPVLFGGATFLLVGRIILSLGGRAFALVLGWLPFMIGVYMRLFFLFQANFLEVFFWTAIAYCAIRYIQTGRNAWLYGFGVSLGLGMMSKYSVAFYAVSIMAGLLISRHRRLFLNPHFYYALALALLIFLPNIIWQYEHRFPVVFHMKELREEQLQYINPVDFIISQFMMNLPCVYIWVMGLCFVIFSGAGKAYRALGWAYAGVIVLLIVLQGKDYYSLGAYPMLFAFGGVYIEQLTARSGKWVRWVLVTASLALGLFALPLVMPLASPAALVRYYHATGLDNKTGFKWEDRQFHPLPQDYADMIGWREMAQKAADVYHALPPAEQDSTMIFCLGYYSAGALNYYARETGLPEVYSTNASFLFWMPDHFSTRCKVRNILLVSHKVPDEGPIWRQFEKITIKDSLVMPLFRENGTRFRLLEHGSDSLCGMIDRAVTAQKMQFAR